MLAPLKDRSVVEHEPTVSRQDAEMTALREARRAQRRSATLSASKVVELTSEVNLLLICQTGCNSHNAYWRVKERCKRTGKPCVFVKRSGIWGFGRLLGVIGHSAANSTDALQNLVDNHSQSHNNANHSRYLFKS